MIGSTLDAPVVCDRGLGEPADQPTLDMEITEVWRRVIGSHEVGCPWCGGKMRPRYGVGPLPVAARCGDCGSSLS